MYERSSEDPDVVHKVKLVLKGQIGSDVFLFQKVAECKDTTLLDACFLQDPRLQKVKHYKYIHST